jgi:hypothetical protein
MAVSLGDIAGTAALAFSIFTFWQQRKLNTQIEWLNTLLIEKEEGDALAAQRADVTASVVHPSKNSYQLKIYNRGKGTARNICIEVLEGDQLFRSSDMTRKLPYPALDTHQSFSLLLSVHMQSPPRTKIRVDWDDGVSGGSKELTLDVF